MYLTAPCCPPSAFMSMPEAGAAAGDLPVLEEEPPRLPSTRANPVPPLSQGEFGSHGNFSFCKK